MIIFIEEMNMGKLIIGYMIGYNLLRLIMVQEAKNLVYLTILVLIWIIFINRKSQIIK